MTGKRTVLFLCSQGGAKSVIAASYFNRLAEERGLPYVGVAAAAEEPYEAVPAPVAEFLDGEGFDVSAFRPRRVDAAELDDAEKVITIGCQVDRSADQGWDVPKVSEDLDASAAAIRRHVEDLADQLASS